MSGHVLVFPRLSRAVETRVEVLKQEAGHGPFEKAQKVRRAESFAINDPRRTPESSGRGR